ncbi:MAG: trypsin-like peptidase domain-containing protein [Deltaproteobacteria bacterium]|nr:trypsin-like peptidase domain-containing protein [Deltaproteobacteria bacterium]MBW2239113.1 trypsin-like peptidase domain-containing protein [Deltaproteobacteria bacterium]MBW2670493.1 trypsin-like peptidase domain-containing protein [Deltaproteobacteria bacterium]
MAEEIMTCPSCGSEVREGRKYIDDYRILEILHEGYSSILCRAIKDGVEKPVMIRIFTPQSGVDKKIADRLKQELEELKKLPEDYFVRHLEIQRSQDGLWYRVSEWIDVESWGTLLASGILQDYRVAFDLFCRIASILEGLHQIGHIIPHLILDDIIIFKGEQEKLELKIDYKLSRFLDPKMDQPGPMLKKLLSCHPDIINNRPLNVRSDIWSLGKIFVELLTADHEATDFQAKINELPLPHEVEVLFKIMLADDPDLRPRSMAEVAETLAQVKDKEIEAISRSRRELTPAPMHEIRGIKKRISLLAIIMTVLVALGGFAWFYFAYKEGDSEATLKDYANQYAGSVAFLLVEYWLDDGETIVYRNKTEGTAFLVDKGGYLLTSRHVACPWLEDGRLFALINRLRQFQRTPSLGYRVFLWFEGEKAFKRLPGLSGRADLDDIYFLESAFSTEKIPRLIIAGVARPPIKTWQLVKSPLKDDFAVFKIDRVPDGLNPLPLDLKLETPKIPRLSPVITLGFPLGSQTQATTVNVSVTKGHVRRTFENLIQVDTSIHRGNSGGPIIDIRGKVIGIASSVAMDWATGPVPVATLLSDMGMVLPITKAAAFLQDLKAGHVKWNGILDLSIDTKLKQITKMAEQGRWVEAQTLADKELKLSFDPALVMAAGMMHFCSGDHKGSRHLFGQALSLDDENDHARLMLFLIDWLASQSNESHYRRELLALDWRSPSEFFGHLVRILEGHIGGKLALKGGYSKSEKSWIHYVVGLILTKRGDLEGSESLLKRAVLAVDSKEWVFFLALSKLKQVQRQRMSSLKNASKRTKYQTQVEAFAQTIQKDLSSKAKRRAELEPLIAKFKHGSMSPRDKQAVLEKILEKDKTNGEILLWLVYYSAMDESWSQALEYVQTFLKIEGRESAGRLNLGLLQPEIFYNIGHEEKAKAKLEEYKQRTKDPWYRAIGECLMDERTEQSLIEKAGESPGHIITAHTALGFWAEGSGDKKKAIRHYKEALGSYMDERIEYEFAIERIKKLRQISE